MKKRIPPSIAVIVILVAVAICGFVYSKLPIGPDLNPPQPKGSSHGIVAGMLKAKQEKTEALFAKHGGVAQKTPGAAAKNGDGASAPTKP
jgi:hypothetical protein